MNSLAGRSHCLQFHHKAKIQQYIQVSVWGTSATYSFKLVQFREYTSAIVIENKEFVAVMWFTLACSTRVIDLELNNSIEKRLWENMVKAPGSPYSERQRDA